jgi:hypothetical protein
MNDKKNDLMLDSISIEKICLRLINAHDNP